MKKSEDRPQKIRTSLDELEILYRLKISPEWVVLKRIMKRYVMNLRSFAYNLPYSIPAEDFKVKHREATAQALGFKRLVAVVEKSGKKLDEEE